MVPREGAWLCRFHSLGAHYLYDMEKQTLNNFCVLSFFHKRISSSDFCQSVKTDINVGLL